MWKEKTMSNGGLSG